MLLMEKGVFLSHFQETPNSLEGNWIKLLSFSQCSFWVCGSYNFGSNDTKFCMQGCKTLIQVGKVSKFSRNIRKYDFCNNFGLSLVFMFYISFLRYGPKHLIANFKSQFSFLYLLPLLLSPALYFSANMIMTLQIFIKPGSSI